ncbi:MAG: hypothetical protein ACXWNX_00190 [Isosphaeraceae bacterium]
MRSQIKAAGDYLLGVLKAELEVAYSRFYNAEPGTDVSLVDRMWPFLMSQPVEHRGELDDGDKERLREEAHMLLEWAAWQLEDLGIVEITTLKGSELIDGEPDFRIELTERGMRFIEEGKTFGYREPENTRFDVSEASRWMLSFLHAGEPGQTLTLRDMMNPEYHLFDVTMVTDDCGNEYPHGSNTYAWGFEVCLWHHARSKHIEPLFDDETQREAWEEHLRHQHLPPRPDSSADRALWHVPFRLVEGVDPDHAQHVGSIGEG